jgi:hypothetical protein
MSASTNKAEWTGKAPPGTDEARRKQHKNGKDHEEQKKDYDAPDPADCLPFRWGTTLTPVLDVQDFVEGLLTKGCLAVVYGDSNVGKSFWVINLLLHVAGGLPWNGREVDQGVVILIALEGGRMTDNRVIAARNRLGLPPSVPLMMVQCPVDLRTNETDAERLVNTIRLAIATSPLPVLLVAIDTMSRALNGGSEGAEEMGALLGNVDRVRHETGVCILFVAHCGKDAARGIRGWSGIRAAIDVEIEITENETGGFVAEVTKQRDLPSGDRFGFTLDVIEMGRNRRGKPVTTCVAEPTAAPSASKKRGRKLRSMTDKQADMWSHIQNAVAASGEPISAGFAMPLQNGISRRALQLALVAGGWFSEGEFSNDGRITKPGPTKENNALTALKRRGHIGFNRDYVWLISEQVL